MDVQLCNNASEANIINKTISVLSTKSCTVKGPLSVETPVILLDYDGDVANDVNYLIIPELHRCYFVTDVIKLTGSRYEVHGKTDVLESFKQAILGLSAIIDKANDGNNINMFLDDGSYITENREFQSVINFDTGFNADGEYILITAGGGGGIV